MKAHRTRTWIVERLPSWGLRGAGLCMVGMGIAMFRRLIGRLAGGRVHQASPEDLLWATAVFATLTIGSALAGLGRHLFDQVERPVLWHGGHVYGSADAGNPAALRSPPDDGQPHGGQP